MATSNETEADAVDISEKERFFRYFQQEITALQEQMDSLGNLASTGGERSDAADHCLAGIARLSNEVKDASVYLPAYDQRTYSQAVKALQEKLAETKASLAPRQRFTFKTARKNPSAVSLNDAAELALQRGYNTPGYHSPGTASSNASSIPGTPNYIRTPPSTDHQSQGPASTIDTTILSPQSEAPWPFEEDEDPLSSAPSGAAPVRRPTFSRVSEVSLSNQSKVHIIVPTAAAHATMPASLTRIKQSVVDISIPTENGKPFASLTIKSIRRSLLVCGAVNGPAHITDVTDSVLVLHCRQFRMHQCRNCVVYLACSSRPIIEDCKGVKFATYPVPYVTNAAPLPANDMWTRVDDFKHLDPSVPSPNWSFLPAPDAVQAEVWADVASSGRGGGKGLGVGGILEAVGVVLD